MAKTSKTDNIITTEYFEACVQNIESSLKRLAEQNESRDKMIADLLKDGPVQVISDTDARKLISDTLTSSLIGKTVKAEVKPITVTAELPYGTESALRSVASSASQLSSVAESITRAEESRRQWWQRVRNHKDALLFGPLILMVILALVSFICWHAPTNTLPILHTKRRLPCRWKTPAKSITMSARVWQIPQSARKPKAASVTLNAFWKKLIDFQ